MDLTREIVGSSRYINERLAHQGKAVKILQWSGDTAPSAQALEIAYRAGLLNLNGGDTSISRGIVIFICSCRFGASSSSEIK